MSSAPFSFVAGMKFFFLRLRFNLRHILLLCSFVAAAAAVVVVGEILIDQTCEL